MALFTFFIEKPGVIAKGHLHAYEPLNACNYVLCVVTVAICHGFRVLHFKMSSAETLIPLGLAAP